MTDLWFTEKLMWCKITADRVCHGRNTEPPGCKGRDEYPGVEERGMGSMCDLVSVGKKMGELKSEGEERTTQKEEVGETAG